MEIKTTKLIETFITELLSTGKTEITENYTDYEPKLTRDEEFDENRELRDLTVRIIKREFPDATFRMGKQDNIIYLISKDGHK